MAKYIKLTIAICSLFYLCQIANAQQGSMNGEYWVGLKKYHKQLFFSAYTFGMIDGIGWGLDQCDKKPSITQMQLARMIFGKIGTEQMIKGVDAFYQDKINLKIPIQKAILFYCVFVNGSEDGANKMLKDWQQQYR